MSNYALQKSIAATLGIAIASTGISFSISSHAQNGIPGIITTPSPGSTVPVKTPSDAMITPEGMLKPSKDPLTMPVKKPSGTMGNPDGMMTPDAGMSKPSKTPTTSAPVKKKMTIVDVALKYKSLKVFVTAIKAADLVDTLSGEGPYTVFAPTNAAFASLPKGTLQNLLKPENKEQLKKILTYHVVAGKVTSKTLKSGKVETVEGSPITVKIRGKQVKINNANLIRTDIKTSNGVIHTIDTVLIPLTN